MLPEEFHVIPMIDDPMRDGVLQLIQTTLVSVELFANVSVELVGSRRNDYIVLGPADAE